MSAGRSGLTRRWCRGVVFTALSVVLWPALPVRAQTPAASNAASAESSTKEAAASAMKCQVGSNVICTVILRTNTALFGRLLSVTPGKSFRIELGNGETKDVPWDDWVEMVPMESNPPPTSSEKAASKSPVGAAATSGAHEAIVGTPAALAATTVTVRPSPKSPEQLKSEPSGNAAQTVKATSQASPSQTSTERPHAGNPSLPRTDGVLSRIDNDRPPIAKPSLKMRQSAHRSTVVAGITLFSGAGLSKLVLGGLSYAGFVRGQWGWFVPVAGPALVMANVGNQVCNCAQAEAYAYGFGAANVLMTISGVILLGYGSSASR